MKYVKRSNSELDFFCFDDVVVLFFSFLFSFFPPSKESSELLK